MIRVTIEEFHQDRAGGSTVVFQKEMKRCGRQFGYVCGDVVRYEADEGNLVVIHDDSQGVLRLVQKLLRKCYMDTVSR